MLWLLQECSCKKFRTRLLQEDACSRMCRKEGCWKLALSYNISDAKHGPNYKIHASPGMVHQVVLDETCCAQQWCWQVRVSCAPDWRRLM